MKLQHFIELSVFGIKTVLLRKKKPILGTIILTDYCSLNCNNCAVNNINKIIYPYVDIRREMEAFYAEGIRILLFNFHTPYDGTEQLTLSASQKAEAV